MSQLHVCHSVSPSVCLSRFLSLPFRFQGKWRFQCGSSGGAESDRKKHRKWVIWMKLPLILQLLVQSHILFSSVVVGSGHYFEALSHLPDVTVLQHYCMKKDEDYEKEPWQLISPSRHTNKNKELLMVCVWNNSAFNTCKGKKKTKNWGKIMIFLNSLETLN